MKKCYSLSLSLSLISAASQNKPFLSLSAISGSSSCFSDLIAFVSIFPFESVLPLVSFFFEFTSSLTCPQHRRPFLPTMMNDWRSISVHVPLSLPLLPSMHSAWLDSSLRGCFFDVSVVPVCQHIPATINRENFHAVTMYDSNLDRSALTLENRGTLFPDIESVRLLAHRRICTFASYLRTPIEGLVFDNLNVSI